jgi:PIN domain nuclease of toxin-antitoxin system
MTFLLDTHTFLWAVRSPGELPVRVRTILATPDSELLLSIVIPWEIAIKSSAGKLNNTMHLLDDFESLTKAGGFTVFETSIRQVIHSGMLPLHHKDPFDRLLIAQALDLRLPILSRDEVFDRYGVKRIWQ